MNSFAKHFYLREFFGQVFVKEEYFNTKNLMFIYRYKFLKYIWGHLLFLDNTTMFNLSFMFVHQRAFIEYVVIKIFAWRWLIVYLFNLVCYSTFSTIFYEVCIYTMYC